MKGYTTVRLNDLAGLGVRQPSTQDLTVEILMREEDGYLNGSKAVQALGREYGNWKQNKKTAQYLLAVSEVTGLTEVQLLDTVKGGRNQARTAVNGTYVHPLVFTHMMQWASPTFGVAVASWIEEWKKVDGNLDRFWRAVRDATPYQDERPEEAVQEELARALTAEREVQCRCGRIDLLTDKLLIEVKCIDDWKSGLGQLIAYGLDYPDRERVLYLYDGRPDRVMREAAASVGIRIAWKKKQLV